LSPQFLNEAMNLSRYPQAFKEEVVRKMLTRGNRTIADMAAELNVPYHSVRNWLRNPKMTDLNRLAGGEKRPQEWSAQQRLQALLDTNTLAPEELNAWCRERGIFPHQLQAWKAQFSMPAKSPAEAGELRKLKGELAGLQRELTRKDKALSEAAALLVLQKKYQALWEDEDK
jgi:transposase-like protein